MPDHVADLLARIAHGLALTHPHLAHSPDKAWLGNHTPQILLRPVHPLTRPSARAVAFAQNNTIRTDAQGTQVCAAFGAILGALREAGRIGLHDLARSPHAPSYCRTFYVHVPSTTTAHQRLAWTSAWQEACVLAGVSPILS